MAIELITGRYGSAHIGSEDIRAYQAYTAGSGRYVLHGGGASIQSANDVHLNPAEILIDGAHVRITGQGEDVTLENGASSYNRVDIVALHYLMTGSGDAAVESVTLEVVKGTPSELTPSDPSMPASGSILDNVSETYVPYVRVLIQGLTPQEPEVLLPDYVNPSDIAGDGEQVNPSVLVNLGSSGADTVFKAEPRPGVYGTLPASKGGTGQTSLQAARNAMGLGNTTGALPVANGGTGATSAATARSNLGITPANIGAAASSHNHSASNITSGTLAVARGGTGVTTSAAIGLKAYPVGSLYFSTNGTSPASRFGGSWTRISGALIAANNGNSITTSGYGGTFKIASGNLPAHSHNYNKSGYRFIGQLIKNGKSGKFSGPMTASGASYQHLYASRDAWDDLWDTATTANNSTSNTNFVPYHFGCYVWYRTA